MTAIHSQLSADCIVLGRFSLCHLLLMNDSSYPWFILVPDRDEIREIYQLDLADREQLLDESCRLSEFIMSAFKGDKLNVAALGNQVPQLHLHHIVRHTSDPAWPTSVWGKFPALPYTDHALSEIRSRFIDAGLSGYQATVESYLA